MPPGIFSTGTLQLVYVYASLLPFPHIIPYIVADISPTSIVLSLERRVKAPTDQRGTAGAGAVAGAVAGQTYIAGYDNIQTKAISRVG